MKTIFKRNWILLLVILFIVVIVCLVIYYVSLSDIRLEHKYEDQIETSINSLTSNELDINEIIPFEWDIAYVYYSIIGEKDFDEYTNHMIQEVDFDSTEVELKLNWVFVIDEEIVFKDWIESFTVTNHAMNNGASLIFSFTPNNSFFIVNRNKNGRVVLTHKGD